MLWEAECQAHRCRRFDHDSGRGSVSFCTSFPCTWGSKPSGCGMAGWTNLLERMPEHGTARPNPCQTCAHQWCSLLIVETLASPETQLNVTDYWLVSLCSPMCNAIYLVFSCHSSNAYLEPSRSASMMPMEYHGIQFITKNMHQRKSSYVF